MRKCVLAAVGLMLAGVVSWTSAPAQAMAISAPAALKIASDKIGLADKVHCWDCGYYGPPRYYRPYYRPYYRSYYSSYRPYYRPYRPYGYGYYHAPRPRFYVGPRVYWY